MVRKLIDFIFLCLTIYKNVCKCDDNSDEIQTLHQRIPKCVDQNWTDWRIRFDDYNQMVWQLVDNNAKPLVETAHKQLIDVSERITELLNDEKLKFKYREMREFVKNIRLYYLYSLTIIIAVQMYNKEVKPPFYKPLKTMDGKHIKPWILSIKEKTEETYDKVIELHDMNKKWIINESAVSEVKNLIDKVREYEHYSESEIDLALTVLPWLSNWIYVRGQYFPHLFTLLKIQERYLTIVSDITLNLPEFVFISTKKMYEKFENNYWFEFLSFIFIIFWFTDYIFILRRII